MKKFFVWLVIVMMVFIFFGCGYNEFQVKDEVIKVVWGEVVNQYQCCVDLILNLVNIVKGYVLYEKDMLEVVICVCVVVISFQIILEVFNDFKVFVKFQEVQG